MKKLLFLLLMGASVIASAQTITFADTNFRNALMNTYCVQLDEEGMYIDDVDSNNDGIIELSEVLAVRRLSIPAAGIQSMSGIEYFTNLKKLECSYNEIQSLDLTALTSLEYLDCTENYITVLNMTGLINIKTLLCGTNQIPSLNVQGNNLLTYLDCSLNNLSSFNGLGLDSLTSLNLYGNQITTINVSVMPNLKNFNCSRNLLTSLDVQGLTNFKTLQCGWNNLGSLNVQGLTKLNYLLCDSANLTSLNIQGLDSLSTLRCSYNSLSSLNVLGLNSLYDLHCDNNQISNLNLQGLINLNYLVCNNNQLTNLNGEELSSLTMLDCSSNNLEMLNIKNNSYEQILNINNNLNLSYICCDASHVDYVQMVVDSSDAPNCVVGSYCSFNPGGVFYYIQGATRIDLDYNGCNVTDAFYRNLKLSIRNGINSGIVISDTSGNYSIPLQAGNYVIKPIFENPAYYSSDSLVISLPAANNPFVHNFCITPNGIHHDLEISIVPLIPARPGFDATYKIVYKNKGNQVESGSFSFSYTDSLVDFVSASQTLITQSAGLLTWNFSNLIPMQSREVVVTMNCNTPSDTSALNVGDVLSFDAVITGAQIDETIVDNSFGLRQTVVGSYDPNDKTCLEGNVITPSMVGNYIHYLVRFENTGTYAAQNIVVKDIIDTSMFEIASLLVTDASHNAYTRVTNGNQVEFIFENIQLPFDEANNDGYIAFKIKTKADLVVGDSIKNIANIYFDYNLPIVTNEAQTTVQNPIVGVDDMNGLTDVIGVYPNPIQDVLSFKSDIKIDKIEIYDLAGRIIQTLEVMNNQANIRELSSGTYLVKVHASAKMYFAKVIKK